MKVLIDTNVIVSAALKDKDPEVVTLWIVAQQDVDWLVSAAILEEYKDVLSRPKFALPEAVLRKWHEMFDDLTAVIDVTFEVDFPRDRKDAKFMACALAGAADYFVTGDQDFSEAQNLIQTTILSVAAFKKLLIENPNSHGVQ